MPASVARKPLRKTRASGATPRTVDLTPQTATVIDGAPFWTRDERYILFHSNRATLSGDSAGTLSHIYRMNPDGTGITAITGPLSTSAVKVGLTTSQSEVAVSLGASTIIYIETTASGTQDLVELNLETRASKAILSNNPSGFSFVALNGPEYGAWPGLNSAVIFAGKASSTAPYKLYVVDTQSGVVTQVTQGISDDRNPALSPATGTTQANSIIAFDSNRATADGGTVQSNRDIWVIPTTPNIAARRVTSFSAGSGASSNIEPAWSTNKPDANYGGYVGGQQLLAFSSTRVDSKNDGLPDAISANGTSDAYWLKVDLGIDPTDPSNPAFTVLTPETALNPAYKLPTGDPGHIYDDRHVTWPQFIATYRVAYQTNRTAFDPVSETSQPPAPSALTPTDIFSSTLLDFNAPTLVRFDESSGEIVNIQPRLSGPGSTVKFSVKLVDLETGIRDAYIQIKNPNSKYQSADGLEHKVFFRGNPSSDGTTRWNGLPYEYESQRVFVGADPADARVNTYANPTYMTSVDDFYAFSGAMSPADEGWLPLKLESRDATTGICTYTASWVSETLNPSDYMIDVIAYDNAVDPFTNDAINWKIYDNVWGFSTAGFQPSHGLLFVSDHAAGQKFFSSRYGTQVLDNVYHTFWGTESWMTDIDVRLLRPTTWSTDSGAGPLGNILNALGVKSYGAYDPTDNYSAWNSDGSVQDGSMADGVDVPVTQQYDIWRILCRGPVTDSVLQQYLPRVEQQPADTIAGETTPRTVTVAERAVFWHAPFTGNIFVGPGSILDLSVQTQISSFMKAGGRMLVNGQDLGWAMTLDGAVSSDFLTNTLHATYVRDFPGSYSGGGLRLGFVFGMFRISGNYALTGAGSYNPISHDPWENRPGTYLSVRGHQYPGPPIPPGNADYISRDTNLVAGGNDTNNPKLFGAPSNLYPDEVRPAGGAINVLTYANGNTAVLYHKDTTTGSRLVYCPMGIEALYPDYFSVPNTNPTVVLLKNRRTELFHNALCWFRTGIVTGNVLDLEGAGRPIENVLVRLTCRTNSAGRPVTEYTALTGPDGGFQFNGVETGGYDITAVKAGYTIQKPSSTVVHGSTRNMVSFRMTAAQPAVITGTVLRTDGTTPIVGAVVTAVDVLPGGATLTATSDVNGAYTITNVPSQTKYSLTCVATGYGASVPVSYTVPKTDDADTTVQPAKTYTGFDFKLKAEQGSATGRVLKDADKTPVAGATVTATLGTQTVTAITDAQGAYSFDKTNATPNGLDAGSWSVVATAPGFQANTAVTAVITSNAATVVEDIYLKTVAPGMVSGLVTRTSDAAPLAGVTIDLTDTAGNKLATAVTGATSTDSSGYRYNYRITDVPAGVTYKVTATLTGFTTVPAFRIAAVTTPTETKNVNFAMQPLYTFPAALSLMSMPYNYQAVDPGELLSIPAADRTNGQFLLATWSLGKYALYPNAEAASIGLGRGYFMSYKSNIALSTEGAKADATRPFSINLNPGWNLVGAPFTAEVDWTRTSIIDGGATKTYAEAIAGGALGAALYGYMSGSYILEYRLAPWRGYWVRAYRSITLLVPPPVAAKPVAVTAPAGRILNGSTGWVVNLAVNAAGVADTDNFMGEAAAAKAGYDAFKVEKPPVFGLRYAYAAFDHADWGDKSGSYGVDLRNPAGGVRTWSFSVRTVGCAGQVALSWPGLAAVRKDLQFALVDMATGAVRDMRSSGGYSWAGGDEPATRLFEIRVSQATSSSLRVTGLAARQAGRSTAASIQYTLSGTAAVEVRVLSASGALLRNLGGAVGRAAGVNQATWDLRDSRGVAAPAGSYLIEVRAKSSDGQAVRGVASLVVTR